MPSQPAEHRPMPPASKFREGKFAVSPMIPVVLWRSMVADKEAVLSSYVTELLSACPEADVIEIRVSKAFGDG